MSAFKSNQPYFAYFSHCSNRRAEQHRIRVFSTCARSSITEMSFSYRAGAVNVKNDRIYFFSSRQASNTLLRQINLEFYRIAGIHFSTAIKTSCTTSSIEIKEVKMSNDPDVIKINGIKVNGISPSETKTPFLIGVAGGTASGKVSNRTSTTHKIIFLVFSFFMEAQKISVYLCVFHVLGNKQKIRANVSNYGAINHNRIRFSIGFSRISCSRPFASESCNNWAKRTWIMLNVR